MHFVRLSLMVIATTFSMMAPVAASACDTNRAMEGNGYMMTPVSMMGRFVFVTRISRRTLRQAVAEQQQTPRTTAPLIRAIL